MPKTFRKLAGACARLEGWGRATRFALMPRDASQRIWAGKRLRSRRAAMLLSMRGRGGAFWPNEAKLRSWPNEPKRHAMLVLVLRSARAGKLPQTPKARTRVSKDGDERLSSPSCFETHRSAFGLWKHLRSRRAATLLSMRARGSRVFWRNEAKDHFAVRSS